VPPVNSHVKQSRCRRRGRYHGFVRPRLLLLPIFFAAVLAGQTDSSTVQRVLARVRANDLKADVSFLASDALEGRGTPSRGLDIAGEYIAAQFRRAGLEPAGDDGFFQTAQYESVKTSQEGLAFRLGEAKAAEGMLAVVTPAPADLLEAGAVKVTANDTSALVALDANALRGKVLIVVAAEGASRSAWTAVQRLGISSGKLGVAAVVIVSPTPMVVSTRPGLREAGTGSAVPIIAVWDKAIYAAVDAAKPGPMDAAVTLRAPAPEVTPVKLRNVIGVLRGSDPQLASTYVVISGHYDHLGIRENAPGDRINNGANDDASGTASVIAVAQALSALDERPKRTLVFIALFGEELGEVGSRWYAHHPVFRLADTVANINLEQLGRTDDNDGPRVSAFNLTGFDYTDLAATFIRAGKANGVQVLKHEKNSDAFFGSSDNANFANAGIPSTTISVAYMFPDYHAVGDEWQKLDYDNMAKVDGAIALGVWEIANGEKAPEWNRENPRTARYTAAREKP
jgi:hypothetical protein